MTTHLAIFIGVNTVGELPELIQSLAVKEGDRIVSIIATTPGEGGDAPFGTDVTSAFAPIVPLDGWIIQKVEKNIDGATCYMLVERG